MCSKFLLIEVKAHCCWQCQEEGRTTSVTHHYWAGETDPGFGAAQDTLWMISKHWGPSFCPVERHTWWQITLLRVLDRRREWYAIYPGGSSIWHLPPQGDIADGKYDQFPRSLQTTDDTLMEVLVLLQHPRICGLCCHSLVILWLWAWCTVLYTLTWYLLWSNFRETWDNKVVMHLFIHLVNIYSAPVCRGLG